MGAMLEKPIPFVATATTDLSAFSWVFVKFSSTSTDANKVVEIATSATVCGILVQGAIAGRDMEIIPLNNQPAKITASAVIAVDAKVIMTTGGKGVSTTANNTNYYFVATEAATADGNVICGYTCNAFYAA
jgi:hypothetical protein